MLRPSEYTKLRGKILVLTLEYKVCHHLFKCRFLKYNLNCPEGQDWVRLVYWAAGSEFSPSLALGRNLRNICGREGRVGAHQEGGAFGAWELSKHEATGLQWACGDKDGKGGKLETGLRILDSSAWERQAEIFLGHPSFQLFIPLKYWVYFHMASFNVIHSS